MKEYRLQIELPTVRDRFAAWLVKRLAQYGTEASVHVPLGSQVVVWEAPADLE